MLTHLLLLLIAGLAAVHFYIRYRKVGRLATAVPGPAPYPFVGNMLSFDISSPINMWQTVRKISDDYYPITRVWMTTQAVFSIRHPDDLQIALTSQKTVEKAWIYQYLHPWLRGGLLTSSGEKWRQRRKLLTPAFHFNSLQRYIDITYEQGETLVKSLRSYGKESIQNLFPVCSRFTLNVMCESAMGVSLDSLDTKISEKYRQALYKMGEIIVYRLPRPYLQDWMLKLTPFLPMMRRQKQAISTLHALSNKVLQERKEYHERTGNKYLQGLTDDVEKSDDDLCMEHKKRLAMLDLLLSAKNDGLIDDNGIKEEADTFIFAGHDSSGVCMTFTLLLLANNKDAQEKARSEVREVLRKSEGRLRMSEVQKLYYLERCIKESLRLYPPVTTIVRHVVEDIQLKHALLPAGTTLACQFYDIHRDPNFWDEPDKFDPDRFLAENVRQRHPFAYMPFSAGSRNCIGQKFALLELKSVVGQILDNFYLEPVTRIADVQLIADIVVRPADHVYLKFVQIEKKYK